MRGQGGLGIGLAIVRHLVERHGGTVHAASPGPGLGATFTVRLPFAQQRTVGRETPAVIADRDAVAAIAATLEGVRMLVVDDDADATEALSAIFRVTRADVRAARSVREA